MTMAMRTPLFYFDRYYSNRKWKRCAAKLMDKCLSVKVFVIQLAGASSETGKCFVFQHWQVRRKSMMNRTLPLRTYSNTNSLACFLRIPSPSKQVQILKLLTQVPDFSGPSPFASVL